MLADVPTADVVVVNPTHYAVALKWKRGKGGAPVCVAKGVDEIAARIRERAAEAGVPIHRDPPTARAICSPRSRSARRSGPSIIAPSPPRSALPRRCARRRAADDG